MFNIIKCTRPIIVSLPNGHNVAVTTIGSVQIKPNLILHNVLYIPSFNYNLLSVSQITKTINVSLIFNHTTCIFQGNNKKIAHGILYNGLYIIKTEDNLTPSTTPLFKPFPIVMSHIRNLHVFHDRLCNTSTNVIKQIKRLTCFTTDMSKLHRTICPIAKQTSFSFPTCHRHALK